MEDVLSKLPAPKLRQTTVGRPCRRILIDAERRGEVSRDEIKSRIGGSARDDRTACVDRAKAAEVGPHGAHHGLVVDFDEVIETTFPYVRRRKTERLEQPGWRLDGFFGCYGKIELDPVAAAGCRQKPASSLEPRGSILGLLARRPQHMCAGERRVPAQIDFDGWCEPP